MRASDLQAWLEEQGAELKVRVTGRACYVLLRAWRKGDVAMATAKGPDLEEAIQRAQRRYLKNKAELARRQDSRILGSY